MSVLTQESRAFLELGQLTKQTLDFATSEVITNPQTLATIQKALQMGRGRKITALRNVSQGEDGTFKGEFRQYVNPRLTKRFGFTFGENELSFKPLNSDEIEKFSEDIEEFATSKSARAGKKLNCKIEQCGGRCLGKGEKCRLNATPQQKALFQSASKQNSTQSTPAPQPIPTPTATVTQGVKKSATTSTQSTPAPQSAPAPAATVTQSAKKSKKSATTSPVKTNAKELTAKRQELVQRVGKKTVEDAEKNVQRILNDPNTNVHVRVGSTDTLEKILGGGFKTSAELGIDTHSIPNLQGGYQVARNRVEAKSMGYSEKNTPPGDRPIYGYIGGKNLKGASHADVAGAYGSITVRLKSEVKERSTFTGADTFKSGIASEMVNKGTPPPPSAASMAYLTRHGYDLDKLPSNYPGGMKNTDNNKSQLTEAAKAKDIDDLAPKLATTGNRYMEAQVHGGVKPTDIAEIHFEPKGAADRPTAAVAQWAKDNGVKIYNNGKEEDLDQLISPPVAKKAKAQKAQKTKKTQKTRTQELNDALDSGDFDKVATFTEDLHKRAKARARTGDRADHTLAELYKDAGYDGKPKVGTAKDVNDAWQNGGTLAVRGMGAGQKSRTEHFDQFKKGDYYAGLGVYGNGTYVSSATGTTKKDAQDALNAIAKHGYSNSQGVTMRMVIAKDAKIVDQTTLKKEYDDTKKKIDQWASAERIKFAGSPPDESAVRKDLDKNYKKAPTLLDSGRKSKLGTVYQLQLQPKKAGEPPLATKGYIIGSSVPGNYVPTDKNGVSLGGVNPQLGTSKADAYRIAMDYHVREESLAGGGKNLSPAKAAELQKFNEKVERMEAVMFGDKGGDDTSGRFATIRGYDAIKLEKSYEPDNFTVLLNRTKVIVQDDELDFDTASAKVGG